MRCHGRSEYGSELPSTLAACSLERISLPESFRGAPPAADLVDEEARRYLQCPEQMLRCNDEDNSLFQSYWDPLLRNDARLYKRLLQTQGGVLFDLHPGAKVYGGGIFL